MKCLYCKDTCNKVQDVYYENGDIAYQHYTCNEYSVVIDYYLNTDNIMKDYRFLFEENGHKYRVFCNVESHHSDCVVQCITKDKIHEIELDFIPKWNPKTIRDKVKLYLTFS